MYYKFVSKWFCYIVPFLFLKSQEAKRMHQNDSNFINDILEKDIKVPQYSSFSTQRKVLILFIVTEAGFLGPVAGNIYIPILYELQEVFNVSETAINGTVSIFMFVMAFAPLLWSSLSDFGGRKVLYISSLGTFVIANAILASIQANIYCLYIFRAVQAFGASSVISLGAGTVADTVEPKHRGKAISYFMLGPQLGPILGPLLAMISHNGQWRWIFGFLLIFGAVVWLMVLFLLPETLRYLVGNGECYNDKHWFLIPKLWQERLTQDDDAYPRPPKPHFKSILKLLSFKPIFIMSLISGLLFASFYGLSVTFARVLKDKYNFNDLQTSISYLCPGLALISGSIISGRISDYNFKKTQKSRESHIPEKRFSQLSIGLVISMAGIIGYGWLIEKNVHVSGVFVFSFLSGFGMTWVFVISTTYLTETVQEQPATSVAIGNLMRNLAAAISAAIIERIISSIGYGWCFTGLGLLHLVGIMLVFVLTKFGPRWRKGQQTK